MSRDRPATGVGDSTIAGAPPGDFIPQHIWEKDGEEVFTEGSTYTYELNEEWDDILVIVKLDAAASVSVAAQLNEDTEANYDYWAANANTETTGSNSLPLVNSTDLSSTFKFTADGTFQNECGARNLTNGSGGPDFITGQNSNIGSPVTSVTIQLGGAADVTVEVYGYNSP